MYIHTVRMEVTMRFLVFLFFLLGVAGPVWSAGMGESSTHAGHGHGAGYQLLLATDPATVEAGKPVRLDLVLKDDFGSPVTELEVVHEKKLHLFVIRQGLDVFAHLHPEMDAAGVLSMGLGFPVGGTYLVYADFKPQNAEAMTLMAKVQVAGDAPAAPPLQPHVPGRVQTADLLADISVQKIYGRHQIGFTLSGLDGSPVADLEPYLGAMGHLVVVSADGHTFVHAHPVTGAKPNEVVFDVHFPGPGVYKGWGQFQRSGKVHEVGFVVDVSGN